MSTIDTASGPPRGAEPEPASFRDRAPNRLRLIAVLTGFLWGAYALITVLHAFTEIDAAPGLLWRSLVADLFGAGLSVGVALMLARMRGRALVWRIGAAVSLSVAATCIYCLAALPLIAPIVPPEYFENGVLETLARLVSLNAWIFLLHAGLFVMLDQTVDLDAASPERSRFEAARAGLLGGHTAYEGLDWRWFWSFQAVFWSGMLVFSIANSVNAGESPLSGWRFLLAEGAGLAASTAAHYLVLRPTRLQALPIRATISLAASAVMCAIYVMAIFSAFYLLDPVAQPRIAGEPVAADLQFFLAVAPRWMFINFPVFLGWSGVYLALDSMRRLRRQERQLYQSIMLAQDSQLKMLRFQLNPHFLFNTLNAISALLMDKRGEDADAMLNRLARFLRHTLDATPSDETPLSDEIQAQRLYLEIERVRFDARLNVVIDVEESCHAALAPMLILQPLMENAIKYAVARSVDPVQIRLSARRAEDGRLELSVIDTGPSPKPDESAPSVESSGVGLRNVESRLSALYGEAGELIAGPRPEGGFSAIIRLPFRVHDRQEQT